MKKVYTIILMTLLFISCGRKDAEIKSNSTIDLDAAIETAEKRKQADPNASGGNKCLLDFQSKISTILTESEVLSATGFSKDSMEMDLDENKKYPNRSLVIYRFENKRKQKSMGGNHYFEIKDMVKISNISPMSLMEFENSYRVPTEEEMNNAKQVLNDVVEGDIDDPNAKAAMEKADQANIDKEQIKKVGGELMGMFQKVAESYIPVENLGDKAVWNTHTNDLVVLKNGVKFEINTDVSAELEDNKQLAVKLAKLVLSKCN